MNYGLYVSASGVMVNSHRQDVIANNLANVETVAFKRDLTTVMERRTARQENGLAMSSSDKMLEALGGGIRLGDTRVDMAPGDYENTGKPLDLGITGEGFFAVGRKGGDIRLTRNGQFTVNQRGHLAMSSDESYEVLDPKRRPISVTGGGAVSVGKDGTITQGKDAVGRIGVFNVPDRAQIRKEGGTMLSYPDMKKLRPAGAETVVRSECIERSNIDPATELAALMDAQRQLEANANMIRYQDQMLSKLVTEVGKIS